MTAGEQAIRHLGECGKLMSSKKFSLQELKFIKAGLEKMLEATENVLKKAEEESA